MYTQPTHVSASSTAYTQLPQWRMANPPNSADPQLTPQLCSVTPSVPTHCLTASGTGNLETESRFAYHHDNTWSFDTWSKDNVTNLKGKLPTSRENFFFSGSLHGVETTAAGWSEIMPSANLIPGIRKGVLLLLNFPVALTVFVYLVLQIKCMLSNLSTCVCMYVVYIYLYTHTHIHI